MVPVIFTGAFLDLPIACLSNSNYPVESRTAPDDTALAVFFLDFLEPSFRVFLFGGLAFVVKLLALAKGKFNLAQTFLEIDFCGNQGQTLLFKLQGQPDDVMFLHQKLPVPFFLMVMDVAVGVFGNMHIDHEKFIAFDAGIGIVDRHFAEPDRFDFGAGEDDAAFEGIEDVVFMADLLLF